MKKVLLAAVVFAGIAMTSCSKDYECVYDGTVISECNDCKGATKTAFDSSCSLAGGTVQEK